MIAIREAAMSVCLVNSAVICTTPIPQSKSTLNGCAGLKYVLRMAQAAITTVRFSLEV
jgi:hypothetical protein